MPTRSRERRGPWLLAGEADRGRGLGHGLPDGGPQDEGDPDPEGEAGQVLGGAELGPFQLHAEAATLGIAELLLQAHASVIQGHDVRQGVGQVGGQPPGRLLPHGPDAHDPNPDGPALRSTACPGARGQSRRRRPPWISW